MKPKFQSLMTKMLHLSCVSAISIFMIGCSNPADEIMEKKGMDCSSESKPCVVEDYAFSDFDFTRFKFNNVTFKNVNFAAGSLNGTSFLNSTLENVEFNGTTKLNSTIFNNVTMSGVKFPVGTEAINEETTVERITRHQIAIEDSELNQVEFSDLHSIEFIKFDNNNINGLTLANVRVKNEIDNNEIINHEMSDFQEKLDIVLRNIEGGDNLSRKYYGKLSGEDTRFSETSFRTEFCYIESSEKAGLTEVYYGCYPKKLSTKNDFLALKDELLSQAQKDVEEYQKQKNATLNSLTKQILLNRQNVFEKIDLKKSEFTKIFKLAASYLKELNNSDAGDLLGRAGLATLEQQLEGLDENKPFATEFDLNQAVYINPYSPGSYSILPPMVHCGTPFKVIMLDEESSMRATLAKLIYGDEPTDSAVQSLDQLSGYTKDVCIKSWLEPSDYRAQVRLEQLKGEMSEYRLNQLRNLADERRTSNVEEAKRNAVEQQAIADFNARKETLRTQFNTEKGREFDTYLAESAKETFIQRALSAAQRAEHYGDNSALVSLQDTKDSELMVRLPENVIQALDIHKQHPKWSPDDITAKVQQTLARRMLSDQLTLLANLSPERQKQQMENTRKMAQYVVKNKINLRIADWRFKNLRAFVAKCDQELSNLPLSQRKDKKIGHCLDQSLKNTI